MKLLLLFLLSLHIANAAVWSRINPEINGAISALNQIITIEMQTISKQLSTGLIHDHNIQLLTIEKESLLSDIFTLQLSDHSMMLQLQTETGKSKALMDSLSKAQIQINETYLFLKEQSIITPFHP